MMFYKDHTLCEYEVCSCAECKHLCYHMYSCDQHCYDYNNGHMCKHIHRVHSIWLQQHQMTVNTAVNAMHIRCKLRKPVQIDMQVQINEKNSQFFGQILIICTYVLIHEVLTELVC